MDSAEMVHIAIMHDRRRAERLPRLLGWLGSNVEAVNSGLDGSITIGDGTRRGAWTAMRWCICDFLRSGAPWMLLLEDDAEPTEGGTDGSLTAEIAENAEEEKRVRERVCSESDLDSAPSAHSAVQSYWPIREACAELVRGRWNGERTRMTIHLCCTGGDAADVMDGWRANHPEAATAPLYGEPVGTVAVLMSRGAAQMVRSYWNDWYREREFEKTYAMTPDAGDARLWEMQRAYPAVVFPRRITVRSLVEHGCAGEGESLVREGWDTPHPTAKTPSTSPPRGEAGEGIQRRMHRPIVGVTPLEWVRSFSAVSASSAVKGSS
jgi:hypothetical protein